MLGIVCGRWGCHVAAGPGVWAMVVPARSHKCSSSHHWACLILDWGTGKEGEGLAGWLGAAPARYRQQSSSSTHA